MIVTVFPAAAAGGGEATAGPNVADARDGLYERLRFVSCNGVTRARTALRARGPAVETQSE